MRDLETQTERVPVDLGDGVVVQMEVATTGREQVAAGALPFEQIGKALTKIAQVVVAPIQAAKPTKATVKYGLAIGIEQGSLMAAIVRGTGSANLEITLEWENKPEKK
jgi:hypothetical protein